jgi:hypothetical protein
MKRIATLLLFCVALLSSETKAQDRSLPGNTFSVGISAGEYGYDSGVGIEVGTPCFGNIPLCLRLRATVSWLEWYKATYDHWARYESINVSMVYHFFTEERSRAYLETGTYTIFPDEKFSQRRSIQGIASSIGIELFLITKPKLNMCYYFSGGYAHIRAYADKLENKPRFGNGFVFNNGFRFYF